MSDRALLNAEMFSAFAAAARDTDNQFRDAQPSAAAVNGYMSALIISEIGAFPVLLAGLLDAQIL